MSIILCPPNIRTCFSLGLLFDILHPESGECSTLMCFHNQVSYFCYAISMAYNVCKDCNFLSVSFFPPTCRSRNFFPSNQHSIRYHRLRIHNHDLSVPFPTICKSHNSYLIHHINPFQAPCEFVTVLHFLYSAYIRVNP